MRLELLDPNSSKSYFNFDHETTHNYNVGKLLPLISMCNFEKRIEQHGVNVIRHKLLVREVHANLTSFSSKQDVENAVAYICTEARSRDAIPSRKFRRILAPLPPTYERRENGS